MIWFTQILLNAWEFVLARLCHLIKTCKCQKASIKKWKVRKKKRLHLIVEYICFALLYYINKYIFITINKL